MVMKKKIVSTTAGEKQLSPDTTAGIASELQKAREAKGLSFSDLNRLSGLSRTALHQYESGTRKPGARELIKLCEVLDVSPNRLLFGTEKPFRESGAVATYAKLSQSDPALAYAMAPFVIPPVMRRLGRESVTAVGMLVDELLRAQDPEHYSKFSETLNELLGMGADQIAKLSNEERVRLYEFKSVDPKKRGTKRKES